MCIIRQSGAREMFIMMGMAKRFHKGHIYRIELIIRLVCVYFSQLIITLLLARLLRVLCTEIYSFSKSERICLPDSKCNEIIINLIK